MKQFIDQLRKNIVEAFCLILLTTGGLVWSLHSAHAVTVERVNGLEKQIEIMRQENRDDHNKIIDMLRDK